MQRRDARKDAVARKGPCIEVEQPVTRTAPSRDERNYRIGLFKVIHIRTLHISKPEFKLS